MADAGEVVGESEVDPVQRTPGNYQEELWKRDQLEMDIKDCKQQLLLKGEVIAVLRERYRSEGK